MELEKFVRYSIRYQIFLAQHVSKHCGTKVYIFDSDGFFDTETTEEIVGGTRTLLKDGLRAVLSMAVKDSFGTAEALFLKFVDESVYETDDVGVYVTYKPSEEESTTTEELVVASEEECTTVETKDITVLKEKLDKIL